MSEQLVQENKTEEVTNQEAEGPSESRDLTEELQELCENDELLKSLSEVVGRPIIRFACLDRRYPEKKVIGALYLDGDAAPLLFALKENVRKPLEALVANNKGRGNTIFNVLKQTVKETITKATGYTFDHKSTIDNQIKWSSIEFLGHWTPESSRRSAEYAQRKRLEAKKAGNSAENRMRTTKTTDMSNEL